MTYGHRPVMVDEVLDYLAPGPGKVFIDATVGGGGHAERLAEAAGPDGRVLGIDRDRAALEASARRLGRFGGRVTLVRARFSEIGRAAGEAGLDPCDGILFDLGVSSGQLDPEERGFSFHGEGPLDMRMDPAGGGPTAADLVNTLSRAELARIIRDYGEERWAGRIAAFVVRSRENSPIRTADRLVEIIKEAIPARARRSGPHPARRTFQALRIAVNDELAELEKALAQVPGLLKSGGRVVVIAYHSLEDRRVKKFFREAERGCVCPPDLPECRCGREPTLRVLTRRPVRPSSREVEENPRSRSARLRAAERLRCSRARAAEQL